MHTNLSRALGLFTVFVLGLIGAQSRLLAAPSNDNFANAITITGASGSTTGTNVGSTSESGEPRPYTGYPFYYSVSGRSVWYRWTAPASGGATFSTNGDFRNLIGVYTGSAVNSLTDVSQFISGGGSKSFSVTFNANIGTTYSIVLDDY